MLASAVFNSCEAGLWAIIAGVLFVASIRSARHRSVSLVAACSFLVFGVTDVIEAHTGSYWEPIWLFFLKGACLLCFLVCILWYRRNRKADRPRPEKGTPHAAGEARADSTGQAGQGAADGGAR